MTTKAKDETKKTDPTPEPTPTPEPVELVAKADFDALKVELDTIKAQLAGSHKQVEVLTSERDALTQQVEAGTAKQAELEGVIEQSKAAQQARLDGILKGLDDGDKAVLATAGDDVGAKLKLYDALHGAGKIGKAGPVPGPSMPGSRLASSDPTPKPAPKTWGEASKRFLGDAREALKKEASA